MKLKFFEQLGKVILNHRKKIEMTQIELANKIGVQQAYISKIENEGMGNIETFAQISDAMNIKPSKLLATTEEIMNINPKKGKAKKAKVKAK